MSLHPKKSNLQSLERRSSDPFWHPEIEKRRVSELRPNTRNARIHPRGQRRKLKAAIKRFGFINPIIIDEHGVILAGHLRFEVARDLGIRLLPTVQICHLSEPEKRAYVLAENRIALDAGWDNEILSVELGELAILLPEVKIDVSLTGFDIAETDIIIGDHESTPTDGDDEDDPPVIAPLVTRSGDLWKMGKHRLVCADSRLSTSYTALMQGEKATMAFTDPPYNVSINSHARGRARKRFAEFAMASGEMSDNEFRRFLLDSLSPLAKSCVDGSIIYICMDWRHLHLLLEVGADVFNELKNICVWVKSNGGQGSFYRSQHEFICVFKHGTAAHLNSFELGQHGRSRSNVWNYAGVNSFKAGRRDELDMHPTVKPIRLVADAMRDCSVRGAIVLDPFMGSGTTLIAGEKVGRRVYGMEIDPRYVDVAIRRWQKFTNREALLEGTDQTFDEVMATRTNNRATGHRRSKHSAEGGHS